MGPVANETAELVAESEYDQGGSRSGDGPIGRYRWVICGLLLAITTLNYMDRQALALLVPILQDPVKGIGLTQVQYGIIVSVFSCAYAVGLLLAGNMVDRIGAKKGYALAVAVWSIAAVGHFFVTVPAVSHLLSSIARGIAGLPVVRQIGFVRNLGAVSGAVIGFGLVRFLLGLGEAGNFPAAIKTVAEWFPKKERSFATGIFNSGTNIGPTVMPFLVGFVAVRLGWRYAFLITGAFAAAWLVIWWKVYSSPASSRYVTPQELAYIDSDPVEPERKVVWSHLLRYRQTWAFLVGKFLTDPIWWFYLFWLPGYLYNRYGLSITRMGLPLLIIYNVCTVGSIFGGWLPTKFVRLGWSGNRARKTAMFLYAAGIVPIVFIGYAPNIWVAIAMISVATAMHQAWSCNLFTLPSDMFPRAAVASVVGIGAFGGACAMMFFGTLVGFILKLTHSNYAPVFIMAGSAYMVAIVAIHLLAPRLSPAKVE